MYGLLVMREGTTPQFIPTDHPQFEIAREAVRDLLQLGFIFDELIPKYVPVDMKGRLKRVADDPALPQDNLQDSRGRDMQWELFVGAMCAKAGMEATTYGPLHHRLAARTCTG